MSLFPWWPKPDDGQPAAPLLRAWVLLKDINFKDLWLVFFSVPALLFFAISGLLAWLTIIGTFIAAIFTKTWNWLWKKRS
jgi:hypothetical protein